MKILVFTGGLGNQIFEYAFYLYLKKIYPSKYIYGLYGNKLSEHYGLEIDKWFHVELPRQTWWVLPITGIFYIYKQCFPNSDWLDLNQLDCVHPNAKVFFPFKFNKKFIPEGEWLKWKIDETALSDENKKILYDIRQSNSCFVHVRRGDYLSPTFKSLFEGCCTYEYYNSALEFIKCKIPDVRFICFSDDIQWMKQNMDLGDNSIFVNWNTDTSSPLDMFLMSQCKAGIIANSTFSYWGAKLGRKKDYVIYPQKWWNSPKGNPDIFYEEWLGL